MREIPRWTHLALLVVWICFIWAHSLVPADLSTDESDLFARLLSPLLTRLGVLEWDTITHIVRKTAHFLEYLVLGVLVYHAFIPAGSSVRAAVPMVLLVIVCVPIIDETIQLFVAGRSGQLSDVLLDMSGALVGFASSLSFKRLRP